MLRSCSLFAILAICCCASAHGSDSPELSAVQSVHVGFGGAYKLGCWTPVEIVLNEPPGQGRGVLLQALDGDAVPARFETATATGNRFLSYVKVGRSEGPMEVLLQSSDRDGAGGQIQSLRTLLPGELAKPLPATNELFVELGGSIGLDEMARRTKQDENDPSRTLVVTLDKAERLPDEWYGYEGVDLLVISGAKDVKQFFVDPKAVAALERWVRLGGLVLIATATEAESLMGKGKLLERFGPGEFAEMATLPLRGVASIEKFAAAEGTEERLNADRMRVPLWRDLRGQAVLGVGDRAAEFPLIVRRSIGLGEVIFVGLDLDDPAFARWPSRPQFLESILNRRPSRGGSPADRTDTSRGRHLGFVDLSGQLRGALDQFDDVSLIPFWAIAMLALAYVGCLFPLNYWLANRMFNRPQLGWVTFVVVASAFSVGVYYFAVQSKGKRLRMNQVDLIDFDVENKLARGTTWFNLFSPENAKFDLQVRAIPSGPENTTGRSNETSPGTMDPVRRIRSNSESHSLISWLGLPGQGLGGMNSQAAVAPLFEEPYEIGAGQGGSSKLEAPGRQGRVVGAPIGIWSSKAFVARWQVPSGAGIEADLSAVGGRLRGAVDNQLHFPLKECVLLFGSLAWPIGDFDAASKKQIESLDPQSSQTIESYLTKRQLYSLKEQVPPYDRAGFDVPRILEVMMFHQQAGGENYTGLLHRYQRYVDLSSQLELGKAVLVGRAAEGAEVQINGKRAAAEVINRHDTVYRFVLPVKTR